MSLRKVPLARYLTMEPAVQLIAENRMHVLMMPGRRYATCSREAGSDGSPSMNQAVARKRTGKTKEKNIACRLRAYMSRLNRRSVASRRRTGDI